MNWLKDSISLLKRKNRLWIACLMAGAIAWCLTFAVVEPHWKMKILDILCAMLNLLMILDMINTSRNEERRSELVRLLADKSDEVILLKGELAKLEDKVAAYKTIKENKQENPIKSNRIVSDKTFAVRLRSLVANLQPCDPAGEEELGYFKMVAERLLKWQTRTVRKDTEEYKYLELLGLMPHPSDNTEEHTEEVPKKSKPKKNPASRKKTKTEPQENENKD